MIRYYMSKSDPQTLTVFETLKYLRSLGYEFRNIDRGGLATLNTRMSWKSLRGRRYNARYLVYRKVGVGRWSTELALKGGNGHYYIDKSYLDASPASPVNLKGVL